MLQRTLYKKQNVDLSSAPWTMHEFFAGSGLVAYGLKGMFAPIWANDISEQKAAVYEANFGCEHFELNDIKIFMEKIYLLLIYLGLVFRVRTYLWQVPWAVFMHPEAG